MCMPTRALACACLHTQAHMHAYTHARMCMPTHGCSYNLFWTLRRFSINCGLPVDLVQLGHQESLGGIRDIDHVNHREPICR